MITIRGQILVSRTDDDTLLPCDVSNVSMCTGTTRTHVETHAGGGAGIHGVFECTHGFFPLLFSVPQHTNTHTTSHGDRQRETERDRERQRETERDSGRRQRKKTEKERREDERGETRQDKRREERLD